jgi:hypothetical protein
MESNPGNASLREAAHLRRGSPAMCGLCQRGVARGAYTRSAHVLVEDCDHYVPLERPDVVDAVLTEQISHMQQA